jgi:hypothetical protein
MGMNESQLSEQVFWRWVNLSEQKWINSSERHRLATFSPGAKSERLWPIAKSELGGPVTPVAFADGGSPMGYFSRRWDGWADLVRLMLWEDSCFRDFLIYEFDAR